jgi:hypothetical protein
MWRRNGLDKHARYGAQSPLERLKAQYLTGAAQGGGDAAGVHAGPPRAS